MSRATPVLLVVILFGTTLFALHSLFASWLSDTVYHDQAKLMVAPNGGNISHINVQHNTHPSRARARQTYQERRASLEPFTVKIIAIGDIHGDAFQALKSLELGGVTDGEGAWTGNVDYLIQTGDIMDRGADTREVIDSMEELRNEAKAAGGTVFSLMGNHEFMNLQGDWADVTEEEKATFGDSDDERWAEITTGFIGTTWADHYISALRLPLHPSLGPPNTDYDGKDTSPLSHAAISFVHGGLSPTYAGLAPFPSNINDLSHSAISKLRETEYAELTKSEKAFLGANGPLWYRGWAEKEDAEVCAQVDEVLQKTGTRRMIMGHTPQFDTEKILSRCDGKILVIDTAMTAFYKGAASALSIVYTLTPKEAAGEGAGTSDPPVWIEREVIKALYEENREDILVNFEREVTGHFSTKFTGTQLT